MKQYRQRLLLAALLIAGGPLLSHSQPGGDRVNLRKLGRAEAKRTALPVAEGESVLEYPSENGQFVGVATHKKGEWAVKEFTLRDIDGRTLWTRKGLRDGTFFVSNQGRVFQRVGEWGGKLQFFSEKGESLGTYEDASLVTAQLPRWNKAGNLLLLAVNNGKDSGRIVALKTDGTVSSSREHKGFLPTRVVAVDGTAFIEGRESDQPFLLVAGPDGNVLKKMPWKRGSISSVERIKADTVVVAPRSCVLLGPNYEERDEYRAEDKTLLLTDSVVSPKGSRIIVKFKRQGASEEAGFLVLDSKVKLIGRKELRGKNLKAKFIDETKAEVEADGDRYAVEMD